MTPNRGLRSFWFLIFLLLLSQSVLGQGLEDYRNLFRKTDIDSLRATNTKEQYCFTIDGTSSVDPENPNLQFEWELQESGKKFKGPRVRPCFEEPGVKLIYLNMFDPTSKMVTAKDTTLEVYISPNVRFEYRGKKNANSLMYFTVPADYRKRHLGSRYIWMFPGEDIKTGPRASTIFARNGNYTVKLLEIKQDGSEFELVSGYEEVIPVNITIRDPNQ